MEGGNGVLSQSKRQRTLTEEEVIAKLKDDGDFDNLRLKIIRKLKDNEELRSKVISIVRQSAAINRAGAESMRPRQLSDAIHDEVGNKVMGLVSDGLWEIIRSGNGGMKDEISETVQSVYNKLLEPERKDEGQSSAHVDGAKLVQSDARYQQNTERPCGAKDDGCSDNELNEPPGFCLSTNRGNKSPENKEEMKLPLHLEVPGPVEKENIQSKVRGMLEMDDVDIGVPPGFAADDEHKLPWDGSDEDPDVPPGFG